MRKIVRLMIAAGALGALAANGQQLPDGPGKDTVQKACSVCHSISLVTGRSLNREQWSREVAQMIDRGAKISPPDFTLIVDYLTRTFPPGAAKAATPRRRGGGMAMGANDKQVVDVPAAKRGRTVYIAECITCHGSTARGHSEGPPNLQGPDLVRSLVVLHDRYGSDIGPFLKKGHPMQSGKESASLTAVQIADLSHFLHQQVDNTLRSGPYSKVLNVLTGDAQAGKAFFNGAGKCSTCHSPTGDLAHIASKYDPPTLQQRFLFPRTMGFGRRGGVTTVKPVMVTVTPPSGGAVTGVLVTMDDFNVALRDSSGEYRSWKRTPELKVEKKDPYQAHIDLLEVYTDKNMHDIVAYLETLK
jgi:mono/diheme cytochrome c family protein